MAQAVNSPKVTVLMPVYNAQKYLSKAIESILSQTFSDFEFLIIDDASTDNSASIIESFNDGRIRFVHNEKNLGLVDTLNKGVALARGEYIARMDNDDISLPQRLSKEVSFLDANADYAVVATNIVLINNEGEETGSWSADINTSTDKEIKATLPQVNCIAHPTVMMRKAVVEKYKFHNNQKGAEDWDFWMRLVADGHEIGKINEPLLRYRVHPLSITMLNQTGKSNQEKTIRIKRNFLLTQLVRLKINSFFFNVFYSYLRGNARWINLYFLPSFLRSLRRLLTTNPVKVFIDFSRLKKYLSKNKHTLLFFFPYTQVGGAERVHANIVECLKDQKPLVFFTGFSPRKSFLSRFENNAKVFNIPEVLNYPLIHEKVKRLIANYINSQTNVKTFGCHSLFYYELSDLLNLHVFCADLKHSFIYPDNGIEKAFLPALMRMDKRVFISKTALENTIKFYHENNIPKSFSERLQYVPNCVHVPQEFIKKEQKEKLSVVYVGRGTAEKRVHLVAQIARICHDKNISAAFKMVGDLSNAISKTTYPYIDFPGEITDEAKLDSIYKDADILLITSSTEGFPMTIMEAMANGVVPISTNVGDVSLHIKNNATGFVTSTNEPDEVVKQITEYIKLLTSNRILLAEMALSVYKYAGENFSRKNFKDTYRSLLI